jgi:hypothetical protein
MAWAIWFSVFWRLLVRRRLTKGFRSEPGSTLNIEALCRTDETSVGRPSRAWPSASIDDDTCRAGAGDTRHNVTPHNAHSGAR